MRISVAALTMLATLGGCNAFAEELKPSGPGTRSFALQGYDAVTLAGADDVTVTVGPTFSVVASGDKTVLDKLKVEVRDGTLEIGRERGNWSWGKTGKAQVRVSLPAMTGAAVAGSGNMTVDRVKADEFEGSIAGSGNLQIAALAAGHVRLSIAGSGDLGVVGTAETARYSIAGSGDILADRLAATALKAEIAGSGNVTAAASGTADISIVGSGDVAIKGNPKCTVSKMGSGNVTCGA